MSSSVQQPHFWQSLTLAWAVIWSHETTTEVIVTTPYWRSNRDIYLLSHIVEFDLITKPFDISFLFLSFMPMVVIFFVFSFFAKNKKKFCFFCAKTKKKTKNIFILIFQLLHTDFKCNFQFKMESNSKMLWHQIFWLNTYYRPGSNQF